jgi:hypothetical protein
MLSPADSIGIVAALDSDINSRRFTGFPFGPLRLDHPANLSSSADDSEDFIIRRIRQSDSVDGPLTGPNHVHSGGSEIKLANNLPTDKVPIVNGRLVLGHFAFPFRVRRFVLSGINISPSNPDVKYFLDK